MLEKASTSVVRAAKEGDLKRLRDLHASGFSLLSIDAQGQTALHWAARHGHRDVVKYLLSSASGALLNMIDNDKWVFFSFFVLQRKARPRCLFLFSRLLVGCRPGDGQSGAVV